MQCRFGFALSAQDHEVVGVGHEASAEASLKPEHLPSQHEPAHVDGPINGKVFSAYVEKILVPTLAQGDIVVLDNLGSHKGKPARAAIRAAGAHLLFLPPYSPDLNPIEQVFAKLKHMMRKAGERTFENTWRRAGALLDLFSPAECQNYLSNAGYASI